MLSNYLKIALRNLRKQSIYSLINILGLSLGLASCILIYLFVRHEMSYDKHHENANRIFRVASDIHFGGNHMNLAVVPAPIAETLINDYPEVQAAMRFRDRGSFLVKKAGTIQNYKETQIVYADNAIFDVFTLPLKFGESRAALQNPSDLIISESIARKYYPDPSLPGGYENPIGKSLILDNRDTYQISGVFEDMPETSHFRFEIIISMTALDESREGIWLSSNFNTYILLKDESAASALESKFPAMLKKYMGPQLLEYIGKDFDAFAKAGNSVRFYLQPLKNIHLHSSLVAELSANGDIKYVYIFSAIAIFMLIIACINFMNLATARSARRAKEVGIRKVLGSHKSQLVGQFLSESVLLSMLALLIALMMVEIVLPFFNTLAERQITTDYLASPLLLPGLIVFSLLVGIFAGSYPALFLSKFLPVRVLKGDLNRSGASGILRSGLVVFQFIASIVLIIATIVVNNQLGFIQNKKLGFDKEQVLVIHDAYGLGDKLQSFKAEVVDHPGVISGTVSGYLPVRSSRSNSGFWPEGHIDETSAVSMQIWDVDYDYVSTMGMEIIKGRDFSRDFGTDSSGIILNESAIKLFGFADNPLGKQIQRFKSDSEENANKKEFETFTVIGVVKDFHFESLRENITPLGINLKQHQSLVSFRLQTADIENILAFIRTKWETFGSGEPFSYSFLNDRFDQMYRAEKRLGDVFNVFAMIAIFIACLGLFGLAAFTAEQRTKEIGVRKVLGASVPGVVGLLTKDFIKLVCIAFLVASPIAWYIMNMWLADFAFRTEIRWWVFALAGAIATVIAMLTISYQAIRTALSNPVKTLRYE